MDHQIKTRQEKKGKGKNSKKDINNKYNMKTVRIKEALMERKGK
jgi:hypothetical protein